MIILHDPQCADFGSALRPEQPRRATLSATLLRTAHPEWEWRIPAIATEEVLLTVHTRAHLARLQRPPDFDDDTPYFEGIYDHARRAVGAALAAMNLALVQHEKAFALMRPPGHHATAGQAMGFCYLNQIALAALHAGYHVRKSEVHGMSQRGGSVESHLRFGAEVFAPLIPAGQADFVVSFDRVEGEKFTDALKPADTSLGAYRDPLPMVY